MTTPHDLLGLEIADDCRYFLGDRPCVWHKREGVACRCDRYEQVQQRLLIIKLDAMGDVLRTTALLPVLAEAHRGAAITWITRSASVDLLAHNPYLTQVIPYGPDAVVCLQTRRFDRVINLDAGTVSAGLAAMARSGRKDGYVLDEHGVVQATNPAAQKWLAMGVFDPLKRRNIRTYQSIMAQILDLPQAGHRYVLALTDAEQAQAKQHLQRLGLDPGQPIVGLNTGAGGRWELKRWREEGFLGLIRRLHALHGVQVVLLGGPEEQARNARLKLAAKGVPVYDAGSDNPVRHFAALVGQCDVVVTGDTLAMHLALATQRRVVVLFGPTSAPEIELYGLGEKIVPDLPCLGCYKPSCGLQPNCMDLISVDMVTQAVGRQLGHVCPPANRRKAS